jgi:hypothetical protein
MRFSGKFIAAFGLAATIAVASTVSASAECQRYGFSVNDYGKDGPTKDAKDLLDKLISTKMTEKGVSDYKTGKKSVSCELFLNFIVFDEHTCTASATVCWGGSKLPASEKVSAEEETASPKEPEVAAEEKHAKKKVVKEAAVHDEAAPVVHKTAAAQTVPDPKSILFKKSKKPAESTEASAPSAVETGSLSDSATKHKAHKAAEDVAPVEEKSDGDAAGYPTPESPTDGSSAAQ